MVDEFELRKQECCNTALNLFKKNTKYRVDDAWDWLCENVDLDSLFDDYLDNASLLMYGKKLKAAYENNELNCYIIAKKISEQLLNEMETSLWTVK